MSYVILCKKLELIASIKKDQTISTVNVAIIKRDCTYRTYQRFWYGENRWKVFEWIQKTIEEAFYSLKNTTMMNEDIIKLKYCLTNTINGLEQLKKTYQDDSELQNKIKILQEDIEKQLIPHESNTIYSHFSSTALHAFDIPHQRYKSKCHKFMSQSYPNNDIISALTTMEDID